MREREFVWMICRNLRTSEWQARLSMGNDRRNSLRAYTPPGGANGRRATTARTVATGTFSFGLTFDRTSAASLASVLLPVAQRIFPLLERELQSLALPLWTARLQLFSAVVLTRAPCFSLSFLS